MPEWLQDSLQGSSDISLRVLAVRLAVALALGCLVAAIYRLTCGSGRNQSAGLMATLVLLTVLICMVTLVIGNSVARAFSLVGALAIVRFRTVVEDTRDTAFVICAVAVGMAVGAGFLIVPLVGLPFVAAAAYLFRPGSGVAPGLSEYVLRVRVGVGNSPDGLLGETFGKHLRSSRLKALATARQGAALDLTYEVGLRRQESIFALVAELNVLEGVQEVELRET